MQEIRGIQQCTVIGLLADLMGRAAGRKISVEEAQSWTLEEYITVHFKASHLYRLTLVHEKLKIRYV